MGGYGSSRWNEHTPKRTVESGLTLNVTRLIGRIIPRKYVTMGGGYRTKIVWRKNGTEIAWISCELRHANGTPWLVLSYSVGNQPQLYIVGLLSTPCQFGGQRWYFACPVCGRRAGCIFLPPGEQVFACKRCHRLTYASVQTAHYDDRNPLVGPLAALINVYARIEAVERRISRCHPRSRNRKRIEARLERLYSHALIARAGDVLRGYSSAV